MAENTLYEALLRKAMAYCAGRESCCSDMRQKISAWGGSERDTERILNYLIKEKFIDEGRYSSSFARDKFKYNKWGKIKIAAALRQKNIPGNVISESLETIDDEAYTNTLRALISGHRRTVKAKSSYELKGKLLRYALSKGFESHLVYDILNESD